MARYAMVALCSLLIAGTALQVGAQVVDERPAPDQTPSDLTPTCTYAQFKAALTSNGYAVQPEAKLDRMIETITVLARPPGVDIHGNYPDTHQGGKNVVGSKRELAMYLAQVMHESIGLSTKKEIGGESASYAPYYGRGYIQLTNRDNYAKASQALFGDNRLVTNPGLVLKTDYNSWLVTAWYWKTRVHGLTGVAAGQFGITTRGINGGECSAYPERAARRCAIYKKAFAAFNLSGTPNCAGC